MAKHIDLPRLQRYHNKEIQRTDSAYVAQVPGKGLSANDYTDADKAKLDKLQNAVKYKGRADAAGDLPADNNEVGDTYFVGPASGSSFAMYVWNGTAWNHVGNPGAISYNSLGNKPQINGVELSGNKSLPQLGIRTAITDITGILTNLTTTNKSTLVQAVNELKSDKLDAADLVPATDDEIDALF